MDKFTDEDKQKSLEFSIDRAIEELSRFRSNPERYKTGNITFFIHMIEGGMDVSLRWNAFDLKFGEVRPLTTGDDPPDDEAPRTL